MTTKAHTDDHHIRDLSVVDARGKLNKHFRKLRGRNVGVKHYHRASTRYKEKIRAR